MSFDDYEDQDAALHIPGYVSQRAMLAEGINRANAVLRELHGEVPGMLAAYVEHAKEEAAAAAAELLVMHPDTPSERIYEMQKRAAGYAQVINWIRDTIQTGHNREVELTDLDEESHNGQQEE